jgi:hypothetical protein
MKWKSLFEFLTLAVVLGCAVSWAEDKKEAKTAEAPQKGSKNQNDIMPWFDLRGIGEEIVEEKKEILLTPKIALELFQKEHPKIKPDWQEKLGQPIEPAPKASKIPEGVLKDMVMQEGNPYAQILGFSGRFVQVMIVQPKGYYLWHRYSACLANFKIPRDAESDKIFDVAELERIYTFRYKGLGYASSEKEVLKVLGEPDATVTYQPFGYFILYYFKDNVTIRFQDSYVRAITPEVPAEIKEEVKEHGKNIIQG